MKELNEMNRFELLGLTAQEAEGMDGYIVNPETGEVTSVEEIEKLIQQKNDKVMGYHAYCVENYEMFAMQAKKFSELAKQWQTKAEAIAEAEKKFLVASGKKKITGPWGQATIRKTTAVEITDEIALMKLYDTNPELFKTTVKPIKTEIKKAIKEGMEVSGAEIVKRDSITIK